MAADGNALIPIEQDTVVLFGRPVTAVRLPDGRIAAVFSDLCAALDLDRASQARRVRTDEVIGDQLLLAQIQTPQGAQPGDLLTAWAIPTWLQGIQVSRLAPEKRPAILAFKREAADVLYRHFAERQHTLSPAPSTLVPAEPIAEPARPETNAPRSAWIAWHEDMARWLAWQEGIEGWRAGVDRRLDSHEEVLRLVPELVERLGPATISVEQQHRIQRGIARLHELTGKPFATLYAELYSHFHVAKHDQLPRERWAEVEAWFRERMARAGGGGERSTCLRQGTRLRPTRTWRTRSPSPPVSPTPA